MCVCVKDGFEKRWRENWTVFGKKGRYFHVSNICQECPLSIPIIQNLYATLAKRKGNMKIDSFSIRSRLVSTSD